MRDVLGPGTILGYCTNVHAGATLAQTLENLDRYATAVKAIASPNEPMGLGLWLSSITASEIDVDLAAWLDDGSRQRPHLYQLMDWLDSAGLIPFTFNGFPFSDFHQPIVKHHVYDPDWTDPRRVQFTNLLFFFLTSIIHERWEGSISTLPIAWRSPNAMRESSDRASRGIVEAIEIPCSDTSVHLDLEPEPGCLLDCSTDVIKFFREHLLPQANHLGVREDEARRCVRVCHDICHSAVMFEDQARVLAAYRDAGIKVGKIQISSAVRIPFDEMSETLRREAFIQLKAFVEPRYLHQTMIRTDDGKLTFFEDLQLAISAVESAQIPLRGEWRVHFHVPIFLERFGLIQTTQSEITNCLAAIKPEDQTHHFEVETYAWNVLPPELKCDDLAEGIAKELLWVKTNFGR